jgi:eukaryotic-like serine/threonine-protein kinase
VTTPKEFLKTRLPSSGAGTSSTELAPRVFTDEGDHEVVQRRLGLFYTVLGSVMTGLFFVGLLVVGVALPDRFWAIHLSVGKILHVVFAGAVLGLGYVCRRGRLLPRWVLSMIDILGIGKMMTVIAFMIVLTPLAIHEEFLLLPAVLLVSSMRAALVPSPPRWTALVSFFAGLPAPFTAYYAATHDPSWVMLKAPRTIVIPFTLAWCVIAIVSSFAISKVVYGLRAEVKKAMKLGQYTLEKKIGEGGMGVVYRARHALLRRPTAVKLLSPDRAASHDIRRFEREVQLTSVLTHPNTVAIYDFGHTPDGIFYYAMEFLDGLSLADLVERDGRQPARRVISIMSQIASALAEAHAIGLVHRDVKPANIFLCERGGLPDFVKVLDFGLVKEVGQVDPALSRADAIAGTPHYMAPESIKEPSNVDARVDIYALGAVGYFLLTGATPFEGTNLVEICSHHLHTPVEAPSARIGSSSPGLLALEKVILACLRKSKEDRPKSAVAVVELLRESETHATSDEEWSLDRASEWWRREKGPTSRQPNEPPATVKEPKNPEKPITGNEPTLVS